MWHARPGRPFLPDGCKRIHRLRIGLTEQEWLLLNIRATAVGLPPVAFARLLVLHLGISVPRPRLNYQVLGALSDIGNNLNQAMRAVNSGRIAGNLRPALEDLLSLLQEIRTALVA